MSVKFRLATEEDAAVMSPKLRASDVLELERGGGDPLTEPFASLRSSLIAWTGENAEGEPVMMFGCAPFGREQGRGIVWLLATEAAKREARALLHGGRYYVSLMSHLFAELFNAVDVENSATRRWLRALGFREGETVPVGPYRHPFVFIHYHRDMPCAT